MLLCGLGLLDQRAVMIASWALRLYDAGQAVSSFRIRISIVIPLSGRTTAVIVLFYAVGDWSLFLSALICLKRR